MQMGDDVEIGPLTKQAATLLCTLLRDMPSDQVRRVLIGANIARGKSHPARFVIHQRDLEEARKVVERGYGTG